MQKKFLQAVYEIKKLGISISLSEQSYCRMAHQVIMDTNTKPLLNSYENPAYYQYGYKLFCGEPTEDDGVLDSLCNLESVNLHLGNDYIEEEGEALEDMEDRFKIKDYCKLGL